MALDLNDKTSNGNTLTNTGGAEITASLPFAASTKAVDLELSEGDYLKASDSASLSITGSLTLEGWFKFESTNTNNGDTFKLLNKSEDVASNHRGYMFFQINDGGTQKLGFIYTPDGNYNGLNDIRVNWTPSTATWYHLAVTFNASNKEVKFYVDGSQVGVTQTGDSSTIENNAISFQIGATNADNTPKHFFDGVIDDVRVWNVVRTVTQINDNKSLHLSGIESGLVAYWPFEVISVNYTKDFNETVTVTDTIQKASTRILSDTTTVSDTLVKGVAKTFTETAIQITDSLTTYLAIQYTKTFNEVITVKDIMWRWLQRTTSFTRQSPDDPTWTEQASDDPDWERS